MEKSCGLVGRLMDYLNVRINQKHCMLTKFNGDSVNEFLETCECIHIWDWRPSVNDCQFYELSCTLQEKITRTGIEVNS